MAACESAFCSFPSTGERGAERPLSDYLFATTLAHRLEATTEVDKVAEQRALDGAGFVREGLLRGRGFVRGQWRDAYMYGRLRDDPVPDIARVTTP